LETINNFFIATVSGRQGLRGAYTINDSDFLNCPHFEKHTNFLYSEKLVIEDVVKYRIAEFGQGENASINFIIEYDISKSFDVSKNPLLQFADIFNQSFNAIYKKDNKQQRLNNKLFRPPYGKIKNSQAKKLQKLGYKIIMWDVLSADFDTCITKEKCLDNVLKNTKAGSIIVFHDSLKAFPNLEYTLPKALKYFKENGFVCASIKED
jgi:hypothetical protein